MLSLLKIKNLALVDEIQWNLSGGLTAVTGETGAGKSVITGALKLIMGERADKNIIRTGQSSCSVETVFDLSAKNISTVNDVLETLGLEACEEDKLIIKRTLTSTSNKQFINNSPVTLSALKRITSDLIDLHGPHDHQKLLSNANQLNYLDRFAQNESLLQSYQKDWTQYRKTQEAYLDFSNAEKASQQEIELLQYQLEEINQLEASENEVEELYAEYEKNQNAHEIGSLIDGALSLIQEEQGLTDKLYELQRFGKLLTQQTQDIGSQLEPIEEIIAHTDDLTRNLENYQATLDIDQERAQNVEEQINLIESLKRKFGGSFASIVSHKEYAEKVLNAHQNHDAELEELRQQAERAKQQLQQIGEKLTKSRSEAAQTLEDRIIKEITGLGFKQAKFGIQVEVSETAQATGFNQIEFLFSPNPGEGLKPLNQVASSGELSRVTLGIKTVLSKQDRVEVQIFDEIDANVGGEIAKAVGEKMAQLSENHQILTISHFPQVAAIADQHMLVHKLVENETTTTYLELLDQATREKELIRMLGGGGKEAQAMAQSLLFS